MADPRLYNFAKMLVNYSARIQPDDRVLIESTTNAEPLIHESLKLILERDGRPYLQLAFPETRKLFMTHASEEALRYANPICALRQDSEKLVDAGLFYKNGNFVI